MKRKEKERRKRDGMEKLPQVLVEEILERLGVKSLVRFTSVSKQWNSMIKSTYFASRHLIRAQSRDPDILLGGEWCPFEPEPYSYLKTLELGSSELKKIHSIPKSKRFCLISGSCDGVVCIYDNLNWLYIINPATRWSRSLPMAKVQQVKRARRNLDSYYTFDHLGFGKDNMTGTYKMVWLYNSLELDLDGQTTCEVFDFSTNTWKHVIGSTHPISFTGETPVYIDGSLYWLTRQFNGETNVICFDLHTEVFQVMVETPILHASPCHIVMCSLNNHLCVSEKGSNSQEIWSLNSHKVWEKTYSINLSITSRLFGNSNFPITPVTLFNQTELLLYYPYTNNPCLLVQDIIIGSYSSYSRVTSDLLQAISFIPSLISV